MSRARHKARAAGGKVTVYSGGDSNVMKQARERKFGGKVEGDSPRKRADRRARGGAVAGRARGGGVGSDKTPMSSAAKISHKDAIS
jgi:hypothetical protein